jgi:hypothetical protein
MIHSCALEVQRAQGRCRLVRYAEIIAVVADRATEATNFATTTFRRYAAYAMPHLGAGRTHVSALPLLHNMGMSSKEHCGYAGIECLTA